MSDLSRSNVSNDAAEAFYGQSDDAFAEQLRLLGATDPRLRSAFERTREFYLSQTRRPGKAH